MEKLLNLIKLNMKEEIESALTSLTRNMVQNHDVVLIIEKLRCDSGVAVGHALVGGLDKYIVKLTPEGYGITKTSLFG